MKWISIWISLLAGLAFSPCSWAQANDVLDPQEVLAIVDLFVGLRPFQEALPCESYARYFAPVQKAEFQCETLSSGIKQCSVNYQTVDTAEGNSVVANCSADQVSIFSDNGLILDISRENFEAQHSNMARIFLSNLSSFVGYPGWVRLDSLTPAEYTLASGQKLQALHLNGEFLIQGAPSGSFPLLITVVKDVPGVAQIARVRLSGQTWIRLKEFQ